MMNALELLLQRMDAIGSSCGNIFPLYSPGTTDRWVSSLGGSWVGGFWGACWWLRSRITGSASDRRKAEDICQHLSSKIAAASINRSLIFWYGAALGDLWFRDVKAHEMAATSIDAIAASYDLKMNCIPLGRDMGGGREGNRLISIDTLAPMIQLLNHTEVPIFHQISRSHADALITACGNDNGAFHPSARFDDSRFQPIEPAGTWSRGQAWGMLGLSRAAALWGEPYLTYAQRACEYWKRSRPEPLAPNRLEDPSGLSDPSSSLIASLAMLSLPELIPNGTPWHTYAHQQITAIIRGQYFIGLSGTSDPAKNGDRPPSGIFWGCCYKSSHEKEELVESAWGSFFLMAALCILLDILQPSEF